MSARDLYWTGAVSADRTNAANYQLVGGGASGGAPVNGDTIYALAARLVTNPTGDDLTPWAVTIVAIISDGGSAFTGTFIVPSMVVGTAIFPYNFDSVMSGGTVGDITLGENSGIAGGTVTGTITYQGSFDYNISCYLANVNLTGAVINVVSQFTVLTDGVHALTTSNTTINALFTQAGSERTITFSYNFNGTLNMPVGGSVIFSGSGAGITFTGKIDPTGVVAWTAADPVTAGPYGIVLNATNAAQTFGGALPTGLPVTINGAGITITAAEAFDIGDVFTVTAGTFAAGAYTHTFRAGFIQGGGTVTSTGRFIMAGTGTLTLSSANAGMELEIAAGTTTLTRNLSCKRIYVAVGATLDGDANDLTIADGLISGGGTVVNCGCAVGTKMVGGIVGVGNDNLTFQPHPQVIRARKRAS